MYIFSQQTNYELNALVRRSLSCRRSLGTLQVTEDKNHGDNFKLTESAPILKWQIEECLNRRR